MQESIPVSRDEYYKWWDNKFLECHNERESRYPTHGSLEWLRCRIFAPWKLLRWEVYEEKDGKFILTPKVSPALKFQQEFSKAGGFSDDISKLMLSTRMGRRFRNWLLKTKVYYGFYKKPSK